MHTVFSRQQILRSSGFQRLASWIYATMEVCLLELTIGSDECDWGIAEFVTSASLSLPQSLRNSADSLCYFCLDIAFQSTTL